MPLFGKKSPGGGSKEGSKSPGKEADSKKTPSVEDKYTLKDVLGT